MGITLPLDKICLRSGILCDSCQRKISEGMVRGDELEVLKALADAEQALSGFEGRYVGSITHGGTLVILIESRGPVPRRLRRELSSRLRQFSEVLVARYSRDLVETINSLIEPSRILGADEIYAPDGLTYKVLRADKRDSRIIARLEPVLKEVSRRLYKREILIEYSEGRERRPRVGPEKSDIKSSLERLGL
ncbi:MAG: hypothetical protein LRS43_05015 [Desulfurococcales archaeon]|nr:hypothetical protein [Desulfurococcales archaeon]